MIKMASYKVFLEYIEDFLWIILFTAGVILLIVGLMLITPLGSALSAISLFLGITMTSFGILVKLGFYSAKITSLDGLGTALISISIVLFAFSITLLQFLTLNVIGVVQEIFKGTPLNRYKILYETERPYGMLSIALLKLSLIIFIIGLLIRIYNAFKT